MLIFVLLVLMVFFFVFVMCVVLKVGFNFLLKVMCSGLVIVDIELFVVGLVFLSFLCVKVIEGVIVMVVVKLNSDFWN